MKEKANEKRLSLIENVLALSDEEVLSAVLQLEPDATTESHGGSHPPDPPPDPPPGGGGK